MLHYVYTNMYESDCVRLMEDIMYLFWEDMENFLKSTSIHLNVYQFNFNSNENFNLSPVCGSGNYQAYEMWKIKW